MTSLAAFQNWAECLTCGTRIVSRSQHDWQACACASEDTQIYVDGGNAYRRFGAGPRAHWRDREGEHRMSAAYEGTK